MVAAEGGSQREWPSSTVWKDTEELIRQGQWGEHSRQRVWLVQRHGVGQCVDLELKQSQ